MVQESPVDRSMACDLLAEYREEPGPLGCTVPAAQTLNKTVAELAAMSDRALAEVKLSRVLADMVSPHGGNALSEVYVRFRRFYYTWYYYSLEQDPKAPREIKWTWFHLATPEEVDQICDHEACEALDIGLGRTNYACDSESADAWCNGIAGFWWHSTRRVVHFREARALQRASLLKVLAELYHEVVGHEPPGTDTPLGPVTPRKAMAEWWARAQTLLNCPVFYLYWRFYPLLMGRTLNGRRQFGFYSDWWRLFQRTLGPMTIGTVADAFLSIWARFPWDSAFCPVVEHPRFPYKWKPTGRIPTFR